MDPAAALGQALATLHRLTVSAMRSPTRQALLFRVLNDTIQLLRYERASFWLFQRGRPFLLGVSGQVEVKRGSDLEVAWTNLVRAIGPGPDPRPLPAPVEGPAVKDWRTVDLGRTEFRALWVPLPVQRGAGVGLWLDRTGADWTEAEMRVLQALASGLAAAWDKLGGAGRMPRRRRVGALLLIGVLLAGAAHVLFQREVPLRVVAPCRVTPLDPYLVTAPLGEVIEEVIVEPGQRVETGEPLFRYDPRARVEELEVARRQVAILTSQVDRARVLAARGEANAGDLETLENRLAQEKARLALAEDAVARLVVRAPVAGVVQMGSPHEWRGKPVQIGERVLVLVDPEQTQVRIWLPVADNVPGLDERDVEVHLHAAPRDTLTARIVYLANDTSESPEGVSSYVADAAWIDGGDPPALGLSGTAVLFGREVTVAEWIFRKPLVRVRAFLGW
ncbi:MAG: HlyD family efflux transporter periplasmic adaptor subunit [Planctomycetes bacterium]|nr:HlyD family efflux transporter periplasmic adaptor subunit [Planctomycetota bacterium]